MLTLLPLSPCRDHDILWLKWGSSSKDDVKKIYHDKKRENSKGVSPSREKKGYVRMILCLHTYIYIYIQINKQTSSQEFHGPATWACIVIRKCQTVSLYYKHLLRCAICIFTPEEDDALRQALLFSVHCWQRWHRDAQVEYILTRLKRGGTLWIDKNGNHACNGMRTYIHTYTCVYIYIYTNKLMYPLPVMRKCRRGVGMSDAMRPMRSLFM